MKEEKALRAEFDAAVAHVGRCVLAFPWERRDAYAEWLAQTFRLVSHTSTLIALTAGKLGVQAPERHRELLAHLREETGHELFARRDLEALGETLEAHPELVATSVLYQAQYYRIERTPPLGLFGYALLLEGVASRVGPTLCERVQRAHGKKACTFLDLHARADTTHYPEGIRWVEGFDPSARESVLANLRQSVELYPAMLDAVVATLGDETRLKVA
jgi:hypothetical protein